ncbi:tyrosine-type recombinase/integrase [Stenotrophomonas maltophilia]|uniref:tyrosine-type recombinase/integrase n=1 Tax=Stenotrophomonas maltophilia TaxID=40324 RepID=UPI00240D2A29|nr:tyrosine-type recombinase/integrase [Stenotrophomonas maltophilia]MDG2509366.1 tyrosine-type recombinase/integrase [Stenotrophomonas maltophilia]
MSSHDLAASSQVKKLRYIESLYSHADRQFGTHALDDALGCLDDVLLAEIPESWFISIRNQSSVGPADESRWRAGLAFVESVVTWLSKSTLPTGRLQQIEARLHRLAHLYGQLHVRRSRQPSQIRSLPASVIKALYEMLDPASAINPFSRQRTRWLVFVSFLLMLHQGLRRGELLLLAADVIKEGFDERLQKSRFWMNVQANPYSDSGDDPRYSKPSIKSASSVRQLPVSDAVAGLVQTYAENYRGRTGHAFLLNTQQDSPLSTESLTKMFLAISASLPPSVLRELKERSGRESVTPHDLRHTCAVVRLNQLLHRGDSMDEALQKLRAFFGWSRESQMPVRYARAVFEDRLSSVWNNEFDSRVEVLRAIPS